MQIVDFRLEIVDLGIRKLVHYFKRLRFTA